MNTPNFPSPDSHNQPVNPGELKISPETMLSPEQMVKLTEELLAGFEVEFPEIGEIPVEIDPAKDGFQSGTKAQMVYTPGITPRPFFDPTERTGKDDIRPKDYATWFMQCFGKTVTMRVRTLNKLPEPADLQHAKVPKIVRGILDTTKDQGSKYDLRAELTNVIAHNLGLPVKNNPYIETVDNAYDWMINKLSAAMAPAEAA